MNLQIYDTYYNPPYKLRYVAVFVPKRNVTLTYACREDVLDGDMVQLTIREKEYNWEPVLHIGEVVYIYDDNEVEKLKKEYWFRMVKLCVVCGREEEERA